MQSAWLHHLCIWAFCTGEKVDFLGVTQYLCLVLLQSSLHLWPLQCSKPLTYLSGVLGNSTWKWNTVTVLGPVVSWFNDHTSKHAGLVYEQHDTWFSKKYATFMSKISSYHVLRTQELKDHACYVVCLLCFIYCALFIYLVFVVLLLLCGKANVRTDWFEKYKCITTQQ